MDTTHIEKEKEKENMKAINRFRVHVQFSTEIRIVTIPNRYELPCTQQYYADYKVCQKQFIEQTYLSRNGNLVGFNYTLELQTHIQKEKEIEKEIEKEFPEEEMEEMMEEIQIDK